MNLIVVVAIIIILVDLGNIFFVLILCRRHKNSYSTYNLWAAVVNSIAIIFNLIYKLYSATCGDPTVCSLIFCKFRPYISQVFSQTARYLTVMACIDRFVLAQFAHELYILITLYRR